MLLVFCFVTGCTSAGRSKTGGSFVKVPQPRRKEAATPELKLAAARVLVRDEQYSDARKLYKEVLAKDDECVEAILGIAHLDQLSMRPEEAEEGFRKAVTLAPNNPKVMNIVGEYYASQENYPKAAELFERAIELDPDQKAYHYSLAVVLSKDGRLNESLPHFTQAVGAGAAHYNVGRILYDQKRLDESEQHFLQALNKDPKLEEAHQWLREVRRSREQELSRRGIRNTPQPTQNPFANSPVAQTSGLKPNVPSQQIIVTGNSTQVLPGGSPQIVMQPQQSVQQPIMQGYPVGANTPSQVPSHPGSNINPNQMAPASTGGLSPAQLEQMRNQQLRSQQQQPTGHWNSPQAY